MNRTLTSALAIACLLGASACTADTSAPPPATEASATTTTEGDSSPAPSDADSSPAPAAADVMPEGARPASTDFPFPVPEGWTELYPFTEEKIGKDLAMSGAFEFPGDAATASATYSQLLEEAGFEIHPNPLGEQVHAASFVVKGTVQGVAYAGTLDFDTDAEGTQQVAIDLPED